MQHKLLFFNRDAMSPSAAFSKINPPLFVLCFHVFSDTESPAQLYRTFPSLQKCSICTDHVHHPQVSNAPSEVHPLGVFFPTSMPTAAASLL